MEDVFENYIFSARKWSAPEFKQADKIKKELERLNLVGRKIKRMRMIGLSYYLTRNWIESAAYEKLSHLPEEERQHYSEYKNIAPDMEFVRSSTIDEPFLIEFEDGDVFEIDTPMDPYYRFSMNRIPWYIGAGTNEPNCEADVLFSMCIGQRIEKVEVETYTLANHLITDETFNGEVVERIVLWLGNNIGLCIQPYIDYCEVYCIDGNDKCLLITFEELKQGIFNWEDLHNDEDIGFYGCGTTFVQEKGVEAPFVTLAPSEKKQRLYVSLLNFILFEWSMNIVLDKRFDGFGEYYLTNQEWEKVLNEAKRILNFGTYEELSDYMIKGCWNGYSYIEEEGESFWKNKRKHEALYSDLCKWSELIMTENGAIYIYGF